MRNRFEDVQLKIKRKTLAKRKTLVERETRVRLVVQASDTRLRAGRPDRRHQAGALMFGSSRAFPLGKLRSTQFYEKPLLFTVVFPRLTCARSSRFCFASTQTSLTSSAQFSEKNDRKRF